jgi:hypothetical protein
MSKILISVIAYKEKDLFGTIFDCYSKAKNKENIYFSIVEEDHPENYSNLNFVPDNQILYRKYDLSEYRGILWARNKTTETHFEYDYILFICAHTRFVENWDELCLQEYQKAIIKNESDNVVLTYCGPDYRFNNDGSIEYAPEDAKNTNVYVKHYLEDFTPGYHFPRGWVIPESPNDKDVREGVWLHYTWCFANKNFLKEVPIDPDINFNAEEPYMSIQAWCRGWRFYATPVVLYYHDTFKQYPGEDKPRFETHRPWVDKNKIDYWNHSDSSMIKLNLLLSGKLEDKFAIEKNKILKYCDATGLNIKATEYNPDYDKIDKYQHCKHLKDQPIIET